MKKKIYYLVSLLFVNCSIANASTLHSMNKETVKKLFINKTFVSIGTDNLNGKTIVNNFMMYMDSTGQVLGKMSSKPKNNPQTDTGKYHINKNGSVNITWKHWDGAKKLCGEFYNTKNAIIAISCDGIFHTVFMKANIKNGNHL